jgi:uncharacterized protein YaaN involved in tellurite resistance
MNMKDMNLNENPVEGLQNHIDFMNAPLRLAEATAKLDALKDEKKAVMQDLNNQIKACEENIRQLSRTIRQDKGD